MAVAVSLGRFHDGGVGIPDAGFLASGAVALALVLSTLSTRRRTGASCPDRAGAVRTASSTPPDAAGFRRY